MLPDNKAVRKIAYLELIKTRRLFLNWADVKIIMLHRDYPLYVYAPQNLS